MTVLLLHSQASCLSSLPASLRADPPRTCGSRGSAQPGVSSRKLAASPTCQFPRRHSPALSLPQHPSLFGCECWLHAPRDCTVLLCTEVSRKGQGTRLGHRREGRSSLQAPVPSTLGGQLGRAGREGRAPPAWEKPAAACLPC